MLLGQTPKEQILQITVWLNSNIGKTNRIKLSKGKNHVVCKSTIKLKGHRNINQILKQNIEEEEEKKQTNIMTYINNG